MADSNNKKIAAVGNKDAVSIFKSLGIDVFYSSDEDELRNIMKKLVAREYLIILITEQEAMKIEDYIVTRGLHPYPIILPIPDGVNPNEYGKKQILSRTEKALGSTGGLE